MKKEEITIPLTLIILLKFLVKFGCIWVDLMV